MDLNGNPDAACMYRTSVYTIGRSHALCTEGAFCLFVVWCIRNSLGGFRAKRHNLVSSFSLQPVGIGLLPGENTVTYCLVNTTVQSASHVGPTPTSLLVKECMMYPVVGGSDSNCGIVSVAVADNISNCPFYVPKLICEALVL